MKKLTLVLFLIFVCLQWNSAQVAVRDLSALEQIQHDQVTWSLEDGHTYLNETQVCFVMNDWWYVVSYEPLIENNGRVAYRRAFLFKKKLNSTTSTWEKADRAQLFEHYSTNDHFLTYDPCNMNSEQKGTSDVEVITVDDEEVVVVFMGMYSMTDDIYRHYTRLFLFRPHSFNPDGSVNFTHTDANLMKDKIFPLKKIADGVFYDMDGGSMRIISDGNMFGFKYTHPNGRGITHKTNQ